MSYGLKASSCDPLSISMQLMLHLCTIRARRSRTKRSDLRFTQDVIHGEKKGKKSDFPSSNSTCSQLIFLKFHTQNMYSQC